MLRTMLKSKIHRATVTQADLHYVGSVTVDEDLLDAADLLPGEQVAIVDITNGARLETYVIPGERGSGVIGINGAAAHLVHPGDLVILISYGQMDDAEARAYRPRVVHVDADNRMVELGTDPAAAAPGTAGDPVPSPLAATPPDPRPARPRCLPRLAPSVAGLSRYAALCPGRKARSRRGGWAGWAVWADCGLSPEGHVRLPWACRRDRRSAAGGGRDAPCVESRGRRVATAALLVGCGAAGGAGRRPGRRLGGLPAAGRVHAGCRGVPGGRLHRDGRPGRYAPVDCAGPHRVETVHVGAFPSARAAAPAGGSTELRGAFAECDTRATGYVGDDWRAGRLRLSVALPSAPGWAAGSRWYRCDLSEVDTVEAGATVVARTGSLRATSRSRPRRSPASSPSCRAATRARARPSAPPTRSAPASTRPCTAGFRAPRPGSRATPTPCPRTAASRSRSTSRPTAARTGATASPASTTAPAADAPGRRPR